MAARSCLLSSKSAAFSCRSLSTSDVKEQASVAQGSISAFILRGILVARRTIPFRYAASDGLLQDVLDRVRAMRVPPRRYSVMGLY
jgi:hypothetical protein